jgi:hypothetical protein
VRRRGAPFDPPAVQETIDFLYRAGFRKDTTNIRCNWKGGVLIDLGDFVWVDGFGWYEDAYLDPLRRPVAAEVRWD